MLEKIFFKKIRWMKINPKNTTSVLVSERQVSFAFGFVLHRDSYKYFHSGPRLVTFIDTPCSTQQSATVAEHAHKFKFYKIDINNFYANV